jgi:hypothetical protein
MQTYAIILIGLLLSSLLYAKEIPHKYEFTVTRIALDMQLEKEKYEQALMQKDTNRTEYPEEKKRTR